METIKDDLEIETINTNINNIVIMNRGRITNNDPDANDDIENDALEVHYSLESAS